MLNRTKQFFAVVLTLALVLFVVPANAVEVTSGPATTVSLSMSISESITVSATPANITFTYSAAGGGSAVASGPITVDTSWALAPGHAAGVMQITWLSSATAALSGPSSIPSSEVFQSFNGGAAVACTGSTQGGGFGVVGAICGNQAIGPNPDPGGTNNRAFPYLLSMSGLGGLTPGTYTGTYNIEAYIL